MWRDNPSKQDNGNVAVAEAFKDLVRLASKKPQEEKKEEMTTPASFVRNLLRKDA